MQEENIWVQAKLAEIEQKFVEIGTGGCIEEEQYSICKLAFDELLGRLPASGPLLSEIKVQYENVINSIVTKRKCAARIEYNRFLKSTEEGTIRNYQQQISEIEAQLVTVRNETSRIQEEIDKLYKERALAQQEKEAWQKQVIQSKPRMTSSKRQCLRLQVEDATNIACLEQELQRVKAESEEIKKTTERRYVSIEKKQSLQLQQAEKEETRLELVEKTKLLRSTLQKLKKAHKAVTMYSKSSRQTDLAEFVLEVFASLNEEEVEVEDQDDPEKQREAGMILDCFETFSTLFQDGLYERAAIMAANSPKGVLRTASIMEKFKLAPKHLDSEKLPLLIYVEALLESALMFKPLSLDESLVCASCILEQYGPTRLSHWIGQKVLPASNHLGRVIYHHCKCQARCKCGCKQLAFAVFEMCGASQQAALCLAELKNFALLLGFGEKLHFSKEDYAAVLYAAPSVELAAFLVMPPRRYLAALTPFEAMHILNTVNASKEGIKLLEMYSKQIELGITEIILRDDRTSWDVWQAIIYHLQVEGSNDWALDLYAALTVKIAITQAVEGIKEELMIAQEHPEHTEKKVEQEDPTSTDTDAQSSEETESPLQSGYSSSADTDSPK